MYTARTFYLNSWFFSVSANSRLLCLKTHTTKLDRLFIPFHSLCLTRILSSIMKMLSFCTFFQTIVSTCIMAALTLSGPGGGSEAGMTKLTADNQKPLTL